MKHLVRRGLLFLSLTLWLVPAARAATPPSFQLPPFTKRPLDNGLKLLLMERHGVPLVSFSVLVRAGGVMDPPGREGLASVTAQLLRRGTRSRSATQIAQELDAVGGLLEFEADADYALGQGEFLSKDVRRGLELLADVLQNPAFPRAEVTKLLRQSQDALKQEKDQPPTVIGRYFDAALFGDHPYGRPVGGDERSLASIRRADVRRFYQDHYGPRAITLAVVGDFTTPDLEREVTRRFGAWRSAVRATPVLLPDPTPVRGRKLVLVDKPDATQTFFMIGNVGVSRTDPDRVALEAVNTAFGGRFTSILNDALRVNAGLTYGARSRFDPGQVPGRFAISSYTRNAATVQALDLAIDLLQRLHTEGLNEAQLRSVQAYLKGQFPPRLETHEQLARQLIALDFDGLDEREINDYVARVDALTLADVRRVIASHFPAQDLVLVLVGRAADVGDAVKKYAPRIDTRPITQVGFR
jgi:predicted Zn-dependent peptidase